MFDFDVVTGPTQPPHCQLADESAAMVGAESAQQPAAATAGVAAGRSEPHPAKEGKPRS